MFFYFKFPNVCFRFEYNYLTHFMLSPLKREEKAFVCFQRLKEEEGGWKGVKDALVSLIRFLKTESPLKIMKNAFYVTLKILFVLKVFKCLSLLFDHVGKRLDWKDKVDFKIDEIVAWLTNNCNAHIAQYFKKSSQTIAFGQLTKYNMRNIFLEKSYTKCGRETIPRPFSKKSKLSISVDRYSKVLYNLLLLCAKLKAIQIY